MRAGVAGTVSLILTVEVDGTVSNVEVEVGLGGGLTEAATAAALAARFHPATDGEGRPIRSRLRWQVRFTLPEQRTRLAPDGGAPPAAPPSPASPAPGALHPGVERFPLGPTAELAIEVREKGTGKRLPEATIYLEDVGELLHLDDQARTSRRLAPGAYVVVVRAPGHAQEDRIERLYGGQRLARTYFIPKERLNEHETVVRAPTPRAETGVVSLEAEEIHNIPGTFGDPFRTALLLPGVGSIISGLGYPVIRGDSPGDNGTFIDEIKVPLLYHLGFGPAVVHPLYLSSLDFSPGNFPAEFGRFSGALIQAHTSDAPPEPQTMLSVDLFKFSAFHSRPVKVRDHEAAVSAAARYGTFAFLARAIDPRAVLSYWDYQVRADLKVGNGDLRLLVFGAEDRTGRLAGVEDSGEMVGDEILRLGFHRLALRYRGRWPRVRLDAGFEIGPDYTSSTGNPQRNNEDAIHLTELVARPYVAATVPLGSKLRLRFGTDLLIQAWRVDIGFVDVPGELANELFPRWALTPGLFVQADWEPTPRLLIRPGVRLDHYEYAMTSGTVRQTGVDPRIAARFALRPGLSVKGGFGLYQSPPRFLVPWPGLEGIGLAQGLNRSYQASLGAELVLPWNATLDGQVYYNWMPNLSEYPIGDESARPSTHDSGQSTYRGRAYGIELIARRRLGQRLFGWVTYSLARAQRDYPLAGWRPADFDQTHLVNVVASYALGRAWTVSGVFHYNSGRPYTPGLSPDELQLPDRNRGRLPDYWRVDVRIEKREAFDTWYLDFYVDWLNVSLRREAVSWDYYRMDAETILLTLPTFGLQVVF